LKSVPGTYDFSSNETETTLQFIVNPRICIFSLLSFELAILRIKSSPFLDAERTGIALAM
jgi:hypothetical protein